MYQKCNDCGYTGEDLTFVIKTTITHQTPNTCCTNCIPHCPKCDSTDLSRLFWDKELTKPYEPPTFFFLKEPLL